MESKTLERWQKIKAFCLGFLSHCIIKPFCLMHDEWFNLMCHRYSLIAAPRGFAKSSLFMRFYPLYIALFEAPKDIVLVSSTENLVIESMLAIIRELETNPKILTYFGNQKSEEKWTNTHIRLNNGSVIRAMGVGAKIRGFRPDIVIIDDIENDENVLSEDFRKKTWEWFWKAVMNTLKPNGQVLITGTILHPLSFINTMLTDIGLEEYWKRFKFQALSIDQAGNEHSVWPEQYPTHWLISKREMNPTAFEQEYMNNPIPDSLRAFHDDDIDYYDTLPPGLSYTTTIDPAIATDSKNDYTAIVTVGIDDSGIMYIAEITRKRMLPDETIEELFNHILQWEPHTVGIETTGFQQMLKTAFELKAKERHLYPNIKELSWDKSKLGNKKKYRIQALQPLYKRRLIKHGKNMASLRIELLSYPAGQHDDLLDALAYHLDIIEPHKSPKRADIPKDSFAAFEAKIKGSLRRQLNWHP